MADDTSWHIVKLTFSSVVVQTHETGCERRGASLQPRASIHSHTGIKITLYLRKYCLFMTTWSTLVKNRPGQSSPYLLAKFPESLRDKSLKFSHNTRIGLNIFVSNFQIYNLKGCENVALSMMTVIFYTFTYNLRTTYCFKNLVV